MRETWKNFSSDNAGTVSPAILAALTVANEGAAASYGADEWTSRLTDIVRAVFEAPAAQIFAVTTGTAANALALSALVPPYGAVYCDAGAHIANDECGAPEFFTGGAKLLQLPSRDGRLSPQIQREHIAAARSIGVHKTLPAAISISQATEWGTVYSTDQLRAIGAEARALGLALHMDGARFANALAATGGTPAALSWQAGVDVLSLGATKNGAMAAEAVIFFRPEQAEEFARRRKRGGHLWSKSRFLAAQLAAYLSDDLWLQNARQANAMARLLADGLAQLTGAKLLQEAQVNEVFALLPAAMAQRLQAAGFGFSPWYMPDHAAIPPGCVPARFVAGCDVREDDVQALLRTAAAT
jgi:threonine aldolase